MSEYVGVVTAVGQQKLAAAIGGTALNLTTIRVGDGNGAPIAPHIGMTDLVRRVGAAYPIISSGRDPVNLTHWRVTALIPAADGPFDIREIGVFDAVGDMIAIAKHVLVEKRSPAQGAAVELTTDIVFPVSETAQVTVQIQPSAAVSILQILRAGFCSVESAQVANPPANPALGATYVVAAAATGAWVGLTNRLVQWNGTVWVSIDPAQGFLVVAQDRALDHSDRWLRRIVGGWVSAAADGAAYGVTRLATEAEAAAGLLDSVALSPLRLRRALNALRGAAEWTAAGTYSWTVPAGVTGVDVVVIGGGGAGGPSGSGTIGGLAGNIGAGGGGGGYSFARLAVTPGSNLTVIVGAGGVAYAAPYGGGAGGTSSFAGAVSATGGVGGNWGENAVSPGGQPGVGIGGSINLAGTAGGFSGPNSATPTVSDTVRFYGRGGLASGGFSIANLAGSGQAGIGAGSGGTGASGGVGIAGGAGAAGAVILRW